MNELEHLREERKNLLRQLLKQDRAMTRLIRVLHINRVALAKPNGIWGMKRYTPTEKQWKEWALGETGPLETRDKMVLQTVHALGGCDAKNEWSKGWDAAINEVFSALQGLGFEWDPDECEGEK